MGRDARFVAPPMARAMLPDNFMREHGIGWLRDDPLSVRLAAPFLRGMTDGIASRVAQRSVIHAQGRICGATTTGTTLTSTSTVCAPPPTITPCSSGTSL